MDWYGSLNDEERINVNTCVNMSPGDCAKFLNDLTNRSLSDQQVTSFRKFLSLSIVTQLKRRMIKKAMVAMVGISQYDEKTKTFKNLDGVKKDVENFRHLFKDSLNYNWMESKPKLTKVDLLEFIDLIVKGLRNRIQREEDFGIIVIYCGHGEANDELIMSDGSKVNLGVIRTKLNYENLGGFEDTPKILIVDACRGPSEPARKKINESEPQPKTRGPSWKNQNDDFISIYSTTPGFNTPDYAMVSQMFDQILSTYADGKTTIEQIVKLMRNKLQEKNGHYCLEITSTNSFEISFKKNG